MTRVNPVPTGGINKASDVRIDQNGYDRWDSHVVVLLLRAYLDRPTV